MSISSNKSVVVRQVFAEDLDNELLMIKAAILRYPFVSIDTEFPGTIFKPSKQVIHEGNPIINYHYMKLNVDALQIIQLGLSLSDAQGNLPDFDSPFSYVWEFNFRDFDINRDCYASDSIELLKRQGIDFEKNKEKGIDSKDFAKKFWDYGLLFNCYGLKSITWITFHGTYDFGFMLKILTQSPLPLHLHSFMHQLAYFFGCNIFDLKYTFKFLGLLGGLEKIAQTLNVARITGSSHQAGSDSLLTLQCFMKLKSENVFQSKWNETNQMLLPPLALYGLVQTEVLGFLDYWGLINFHPVDSAAVSADDDESAVLDDLLRDLRDHLLITIATLVQLIALGSATIARSSFMFLREQEGILSLKMSEATETKTTSQYDEVPQEGIR
ncbi:hypothetical protein Goshw_004777 [Gossypium schwendimanii]|uniref:poly(A)-specific ribonuclease n=2 Tax=Gossypium TaxID=3633 RepID=A0A7J9L7W1_GOSSC|nr:hypothetical protein [Gossypium schwendimanii]